VDEGPANTDARYERASVGAISKNLVQLSLCPPSTGLDQPCVASLHGLGSVEEHNEPTSETSGHRRQSLAVRERAGGAQSVSLANQLLPRDTRVFVLHRPGAPGWPPEGSGPM